MPRRLALALALLLPCAPAWAQSVVDIRDYGAVASTMPSGGTESLERARATRVAIQAAIDAAGANGVGQVKIPAGVWAIDRPIRLDRAINDAARVSLRGEGAGLSVLRVRKGSGYDAVLVGLDRAPRGPDRRPVTLDPATFVAADALLDGSAPGRTALRLAPRVHLAQQGGHLDRAGDWYAGCRVLTVDLLVDLTGADLSGYVPLCGLRDGRAPMPWLLMVGRGQLYVSYQTIGDPDDWERGTVRDGFFAGAVPAGPARITLEIDLDAGTPRARVNGAPQSYVHRTGPRPAPGERFFPNQHTPFRVGSLAATMTGPNQFVGSPVAMTVAGLKVSTRPVYGPDWKPLGGRPENDYTRYFDEATPGGAGLLPLKDDPATSSADRLVATRGPNGYGLVNDAGAYLLDPTLHSSTMGTVMAGRIEGLSIEGGDPNHGRALAYAAAYYLDVRDCTLAGGAHGIGAYNCEAPSYPITVRDCTLTATESPAYLYFGPLATIRDCHFGAPAYRAGIRAVNCSGLDLDSLDFPHWGKPDYGLCLRASDGRIGRVGFDNEAAGQGSQKANLYATPPQDKQDSPLTIDGLSSSATGRDAAAVVLGAPADVTGRIAAMGDCPVRIRNLAMHPNYPARAQVRTLPRAAGIWRDSGVELAPSCPWPRFDGPPLPGPVAVPAAPVVVPTPAVAPGG